MLVSGRLHTHRPTRKPNCVFLFFSSRSIHLKATPGKMKLLESLGR